MMNHLKDNVDEYCLFDFGLKILNIWYYRFIEYMKFVTLLLVYWIT